MLSPLPPTPRLWPPQKEKRPPKPNPPHGCRHPERPLQRPALPDPHPGTPLAKKKRGPLQPAAPRCRPPKQTPPKPHKFFDLGPTRQNGCARLRSVARAQQRELLLFHLALDDDRRLDQDQQD